MRSTIAIILVSLVASSPVAAAASASQVPGGSWKSSCFADFTMKGSVLTAKCGKINGQFASSFINVDKCNEPVAIGNQDGRLVCESGVAAPGAGPGMPPGSWAASCKNPSVKKHILRAFCTDTSGVDRPTQIDLDECPGTISNLDGSLTCD